MQDSLRNPLGCSPDVGGGEMKDITHLLPIFLEKTVPSKCAYSCAFGGYISFFHSFAVLAHSHAVLFLELLRSPADVIETTFKNDFRNIVVAVTQHISDIV